MGVIANEICIGLYILYIYIFFFNKMINHTNCVCVSVCVCVHMHLCKSKPGQVEGGEHTCDSEIICMCLF